MKPIIIVSRLLIVYGLFAWWWFTPAQEQVKPPEWTPPGEGDGHPAIEISRAPRMFP